MCGMYFALLLRVHYIMFHTTSQLVLPCSFRSPTPYCVALASTPSNQPSRASSSTSPAPPGCSRCVSAQFDSTLLSHVGLPLLSQASGSLGPGYAQRTRLRGVPTAAVLIASSEPTELVRFQRSAAEGMLLRGSAPSMPAVDDPETPLSLTPAPAPARYRRRAPVLCWSHCAESRPVRELDTRRRVLLGARCSHELASPLPSVDVFHGRHITEGLNSMTPYPHECPRQRL